MNNTLDLIVYRPDPDEVAEYDTSLFVSFKDIFCDKSHPCFLSFDCDDISEQILDLGGTIVDSQNITLEMMQKDIGYAMEGLICGCSKNYTTDQLIKILRTLSFVGRIYEITITEGKMAPDGSFPLIHKIVNVY